VPHLSLPLPLPDGPRSSAAPSLGTVAAGHPSVSPLPLCSAAARAHRARPPVSGRCQPGATRRSAGTPPARAASSTRRWRRPTPPLIPPFVGPFKKGTPPPPAKIHPHAVISSSPLRRRATATSIASHRAAPPLTGARLSPQSAAASASMPPL
jgi:hypothetical protein